MSSMAYLIGAMIAIAVLAFLLWDHIKPFFRDSETLFWGRLQVLIGTLMATNLAPIVPPKYLPYYILLSGIVTELARRSRGKTLE